ncbi:MAG: serine/threonine protein kinase [Gammaproteobacteria bacterium]|nr:serine/threonine protein kinase [Gammaproteobacteria bacterium]
MTDKMDVVTKTFEAFYSGGMTLDQLTERLISLVVYEGGQLEPLVFQIGSEVSAGRLPVQIERHLVLAIQQAVVSNRSSDLDSTVCQSPPSENSAFDEPKIALVKEVVPAEPSVVSVSLSMSPKSVPIPLREGLILKGQYRLESELGAGGMGIVFKARDLLMEEMKDREPYVAIKILRPEYRDNQQVLMALQREFRKAQKLSHPNIVGMMNFTRDDDLGIVFITMQYLEGKTLGDLLVTTYPEGMPLKAALPIIQGMSHALSYAHKNHIIHLDFKPANVFISNHGEVKILDFGIASIATSATAEQQLTVFNPQDLSALTPAYASLEMLDRLEGDPSTRFPPDPRDDVYGLACVIYELLTGRHPFARASAKDAFKSGLTPKEPLGLTGRQWKSLRKGLAFSREDRTQQVDELLKGLEPFSFFGPNLLKALLVISIAAGIGLHNFRLEETSCRSPVLTPDETARVKDLLEVAAVHMDIGYYTSPPASNALLAYQEVLKLDPCNNAATLGLNRISDIEEQEAWAAFERGDATSSLDKVNDGLKANPDHKGLKALKSKLSGDSRDPERPSSR